MQASAAMLYTLVRGYGFELLTVAGEYVDKDANATMLNPCRPGAMTNLVGLHTKVPARHT